MFKIISGVINIGLSLGVAFLTFVALSSHFGGSQEKFDRYERLVNEGIPKMAAFSSEFKETRVNVSRVDVTIYHVKYAFQVEGKTYTGKYYFDDPKIVFTDSVQIQYLPEDPTMNAANAQEEFDEVSAELDSGRDLWFGIAGVILCIGMIFYGIRKIRKGMREMREPQRR